MMSPDRQPPPAGIHDPASKRPSEDGVEPSYCHRYRTEALVGPWRRSRDEAIADALRAELAFRDDDTGLVHWRVAGEIEQAPCQAGSPCSDSWEKTDGPAPGREVRPGRRPA